MKGHFVETL